MARFGLAAVAAALLASCAPGSRTAPPKGGPEMKTAPTPGAPAQTEADYRKKLTSEQYHVLREGGTERPYSGEFLHHKEPGTYVCGACEKPLFASTTKYDSCGWPSFWDALPGAVGTRPDGGSLEAVCAGCGSHLGHLFDDGPPPTGRRY